MHNDFFTSGKDFSAIESDFNANCKAAVFALYKGERSIGEILRLSQKLYRLKAADDRFNLAYEDAGYLTLQNAEQFLSFCPSYISLTWNGENPLGYGCAVNKPLKAAGREMALFLNKKGMVLDTAHLSKKGFCDIIDIVDKVINSHTCFNAVHKHRRNISDRQIELIIEKGGIIGLTLVSDFLGGCAIGSEHVIRHISHFLDKFGDENLCIGTDFFGTDKLPRGVDSYNSLLKLSADIIKCGYSYDTLANIFYKNYENYFRKEK